ncbi:elongation of very long chain fatty acids protein 7 [Zeugodacus cucurbitae]|nr:elongation of very long chain fatty acids protein 7 [Zeugodacus cucurbitae]
MFFLLQLIWDYLREFDDKYRDRRSENYFLFSPLQVTLTLVAYYVFVKHLGPKLMENRAAFDLKYVLLVYNAAQVLINSGSLIMASYYTWLHKPYDRLTCMMPVMDSNVVGMIELRYSYIYYLLKVFDLADTVFFVLRKRYNQVSFLHVYHHIMITVATFIYLRYLPGGHGAVLALLNLAVHAIMYFYYLISVLRPELKQSLWWKKHITHAQIVQFVILFVHFGRALFDRTCLYPTVALFFGTTQAAIMLVLFCDFYYKAYLLPNKRKLVKK